MTTSSYNTALSYGDGLVAAGPSYTEVTGVDAITPPAVTVANTSTRHLKTSNQFNTKKATWKDAGDIEVELFYDKTQFNTLLGLAGTHRAWKIEFADGATLVCDAFISSISPPIAIEDEVKISMTLTVVALPTFSTS